MTVDGSPLGPSLAARSHAWAAELARSVLACPAEVSLVVEDLDDVAAGLHDEQQLGMRDVGGRPTFTCPPDAALVAAAEEGRRALVTVVSGLGRTGSADRDADLRLEGRLEARAVEGCTCCGPVVEVALRPDVVLLRPRRSLRTGPGVRVPVGAFVSARHHLNRGFLQRTTEHANRCHQDELRHAVAMASGTRFGEVVAVQLCDLRPKGVTVQWVDRAGAHADEVGFGRPARSPEDLGELLRRRLHAGLC